MTRPATSIDRRLQLEVPALRRHRAATYVLTSASALTVVGQAVLLALVLTAAVDGAGPAPLAVLAGALTGTVALRAGLSWARSVLDRRSATAVVATLRGRILSHTARMGPVALGGNRHGELTTMLTTGLDALAPYLTGYRPKMIAATVVPVVVLAGLAVVDLSSALIIVVTLPLIPVFGALVGAHTRARTARQWGRLARLGGHFLDATTGLPTLRAFGRAEHQVGVVTRMAQAHREETMRTLRVAFLSALVLELVATLSVALVAVPMGLRLLEGSVPLATALIVLFLAPEAYLPLRAAGSAFHDSAQGVAVAEKAFAFLDDEPSGAAPAGQAPATHRRAPARTPAPALHLDRVTVRYPDRDVPAVRDVSLRVAAGERVALVGPSGAGKSTLLAALLGFVTPESGGVRVDGDALGELDVARWRERIAWVPQRPHLFATSVAANIALGRPGTGLDEIRRAARSAGADEFVRALPQGYDTVLGERGTGLSTGQRQRIALARAFLRDAPLLLLDEPTANLDPRSEAGVVDASIRLMAGRTAIVVVHRPALLPHVDRVVRLDADGPAGTVPDPLDLEPVGSLR